MSTKVLRHLVSKKKRRFQKDGFDLDLTYIQKNIIAMGYPSESTEALYRNDLKDVVRFFTKYHNNKYKVYNLCSERLYDSAHFQDSVANFPFDDHNCPPLPLLQAFCRSAEAYLASDPENVIAVHCKAGKSRTGLMICCLLMHLKIVNSADDALVLYNRARTQDGKGVTIPSQRRYIRYYEHILGNGNVMPAEPMFFVMMIHLDHIPASFKPEIVVKNHEGTLYTTRKDASPNNIDSTNVAAAGDQIMYILDQGIEVRGDFKLEFWYNGSLAFYSWFNTAYLREPKLETTRENLDKFKLKKKFPSSFVVRLSLLRDDGGRARVASGPPKASQPAKQESEDDKELSLSEMLGSSRLSEPSGADTDPAGAAPVVNDDDVPGTEDIGSDSDSEEDLPLEVPPVDESETTDSAAPATE